MRLYAIDSWDNERFYVKTKGRVITSRQFVHNRGVKICGVGNWKEEFVVLDVTFGHTDRRLDLWFESSLNEHANNESWGFSDV